MYSAIEIAKYVVSKCVQDEKPISNLQLQKILYYIQRDYLKNGCRAFLDNIEAWTFGPVVPNVYYYFCGSGAMPITPLRLYNSDSIKRDDKAKFDSIVDVKRELRPWDMVAETHQKGGAWDLIYQNGKGNRQVIPVDLIRTAG